MPPDIRREVDPFRSPTAHSTLATTAWQPRPQTPDVLATADLFLGQLKELENLCHTVEERVQRKRQALKEIEHLIFGSSSSVDGSPQSPVCPTNTPIGARLNLVSPRLRGLFDLRGPGQVNLDATQSCLDYSPDVLSDDNLSTREDVGHSEAWVDDDDDGYDEGLTSPFDDKYAPRQSPKKAAEKELPATSLHERSKIPRKVHIRRQVSVSRRLAERPSGTVVRNTSNRRRASVRDIKDTSDLGNKGTMRRGSWKRSIREGMRIKGGAVENDSGAKEIGSRKEKRKGLKSIYSVCVELSERGSTVAST